MLKDIGLLIDKINYQYKQNRFLKSIIRTFSFIMMFIIVYLLIMPAFTLNGEPEKYILHLLDSYDYSWKDGLTSGYDLNLYFMDTNDNYIDGRDITIEIGKDALRDDPYGFGYVPISGESTRGLNIIDELSLTEYTLSTGEKYVFDHAEVYVNGVWQPFDAESNHWDIWCQYASSSTVQEDYGWRGKYGNNVAYIITSETEYKLVYKLVRYGKEESVESLGSDSGIAFGIFNYAGTNEKNGINDNGLWNYFTFRDSTLGTSSVINGNTDADGFTENRARVLPKLENGYPVFDCRGYCTNANLGYLFGASTNAEGLEPKGVTTYSPSNTLLQKEIVGGAEYYYYDSNRNAVDYDTENNVFMLRDYVERGFQLSSYPSEINRYEFLPFNYWNDSRTLSSVDGTDFTYNYEKEEIDHWFGMTMEFDFYMPKDGMINGSDMIFSFSGDDDVWVFIDDVLILDLGGTHGAVDGNINFKTGEVTSYLNWNGTLGTSNVTNIYDAFSAANASNNTLWNDENEAFANYTRHTLKFFYLERGAAISNCKIRFNIPVLPSGSLSVQKLFDGKDNYNEEHEFILYDVTSNTVASDVKYTINGNEYYTNSEGHFTLRTGEVATFSLTNYHTYYVEETNPGTHSVNYNCILDGVECDMPSKTNVFTIEPESSYEAVFINKVKTYNLNVSKIAYNSTEEETFIFEIELVDYDGTKINIPNNINSMGGYEIDSENQILMFGLKSGDNITINDIPVDTKVNVSEINHDGYSTVIKSEDITLSENDNYEFIMDSNKNITVYNIPGVVLPETGGNGIFLYLLIGMFLIFISIMGYNYLLKLKEGGC